jgi:hypothetical protein
MKVRRGFVTNSSSTCYVCEITGEKASGMDIVLRDWNMLRCTNNHVFMESFAVGDDLTITDKRRMLIEYFENSTYLAKEGYPEQAHAWTDEEIEEEFDEWFEDEVPPSRCPICSLSHIRDKDALNYLLKKVGMNREELHKEIKSKFSTLSEFKKDDRG